MKNNLTKTPNPTFTRPITVVMDPSHKNWVLGGIFRDAIKTNPAMFEKSVYFYHPSIRNLPFLTNVKSGLSNRNLLFTSLTPLVNFLRVPGRNRPKTISLWFTHKEGKLNREEIRALRSCDYVFLHSFWEVENLTKFTNAKLIPLIGAVVPDRFSRPSVIGKKVVIVGTPSPRKNPQLLISIVRQLTNIDFLLIGKSWSNSPYWNDLLGINNVTYREIEGPLESRNLDGCSTYLCLSSIEGGPIPLLETMAAGLIPISTPVGIARDLLPKANLQNNFINIQFQKNVVAKINAVHANTTDIQRELIRRIALTYDIENFTRRIFSFINF